MSQEVVCVHVWISGRVQGVGYRYSAKAQANILGLTGWVRNLLDGRVEAVFQGDRAQVEAMLRWCHQGPLSAKVNQVIVNDEAPQAFEGFEIRR
ncbi:MAG: acylphosphatase [Alkalinema sp. CACIAM 70d]|nr:MAG: acylphosphatase [Alkalinema sp. CACIAM 70d]